MCSLPNDSVNESHTTCNAYHTVRDPDQSDMLYEINRISDFVMKISDMGLSRHKDDTGEDKPFFSSISHRPSHQFSKNSNRHREESIVGTIGWQAPELIRRQRVPNSSQQTEEHRDFKVDIFSLGCIFYFVISRGNHPHGIRFERESNILNGKVNWSNIQGCNFEVYDLICRMLHPVATSRPSASEILRHPFFWNSSQRLAFLTYFSDYLEKLSPQDDLILRLESYFSEVVGHSSWESLIDTELVYEIGRHRKYDFSSLRDLLRVIRNKRSHFDELSNDLKAKMHPLPGKFLFYFESRFPKLFFRCVFVLSRSFHHEMFYVQEMSSLFEDITSILQCDVSDVMAGYSLESDVVNNNSLVDEATLLDQSQSVVDVRFESVCDVNASEMDTFEQCRAPLEENYEERSNMSIFSSSTLWHGSALLKSTTSNNHESNSKILCNRHAMYSSGWLRNANIWTRADIYNPTTLTPGEAPAKKTRMFCNHIQTASLDPKYRTRLCTHWENSMGLSCPQKKKGKCSFAHGALELRVSRKDKWGKNEYFPRYPCIDYRNIKELLLIAMTSEWSDDTAAYYLPRYSGGEDVLGAAQSLGKIQYHSIHDQSISVDNSYAFSYDSNISSSDYYQDCRFSNNSEWNPYLARPEYSSRDDYNGTYKHMNGSGSFGYFPSSSPHQQHQSQQRTSNYFY